MYCGAELPHHDRFCPHCGKECRRSWRELCAGVPMWLAIVGASVLMLLVGLVGSPKHTVEVFGVYKSTKGEATVSLKLEDGQALFSDEKGTFSGEYKKTKSGDVYDMTLSNENGDTVFLSVFGDEEKLLVFEQISSNTVERYVLKKDRKDR